jgi:hypothetical protein
MLWSQERTTLDFIVLVLPVFDADCRFVRKDFGLLLAVVPCAAANKSSSVASLSRHAVGAVGIVGIVVSGVIGAGGAAGAGSCSVGLMPKRSEPLFILILFCFLNEGGESCLLFCDSCPNDTLSHDS